MTGLGAGWRVVQGFLTPPWLGGEVEGPAWVSAWMDTAGCCAKQYVTHGICRQSVTCSTDDDDLGSGLHEHQLLHIK
jgi:hypothetical protein